VKWLSPASPHQPCERTSSGCPLSLFIRLIQASLLFSAPFDRVSDLHYIFIAFSRAVPQRSLKTNPELVH
jgi:hypothetical protein